MSSQIQYILVAVITSLMILNSAYAERRVAKGKSGKNFDSLEINYATPFFLPNRQEKKSVCVRVGLWLKISPTQVEKYSFHSIYINKG